MPDPVSTFAELLVMIAMMGGLATLALCTPRGPARGMEGFRRLAIPLLLLGTDLALVFDGAPLVAPFTDPVRLALTGWLAFGIVDVIGRRLWPQRRATTEREMRQVPG
ncbi:MAG: hypothetical protein H6739_36485 [Alphaproteobacteria bacterium]|nr:hypothetical protein [Alphaproteobacteria bacterium]